MIYHDKMIPPYPDAGRLPEGNDPETDWQYDHSLNRSVFSPLFLTFQWIVSFHRFWLIAALLIQFQWLFTLGNCTWLIATSPCFAGEILLVPIFLWLYGSPLIVMGSAAAVCSERRIVRKLACGNLVLVSIAPVIGYAAFELSRWLRRCHIAT